MPSSERRTGRHLAPEEGDTLLWSLLAAILGPQDCLVDTRLWADLGPDVRTRPEGKGVALAKEVIASGAAYETLEKVISLSNSL